MDFEGFKVDTKTMKAVELNLIVIGEAAAGIPDSLEERRPQIPWILMRAMRKRLVHVYFLWMNGLYGIRFRMIYHL